MARRRTRDVVDVATGLATAATEGAEALLEALVPSRRPRRQWRNLSEAQKKRYLSAGRTGRLNGRPGLTARQVRDYYNRGGSLKAARGYHPPKGAAPRQATLRAQAGVATKQDVETLRAAREKAPSWIPKDRALLSDDTAAALSQIGSAPRNWKTVVVTPLPDRSGFLMTVTTKRGATWVTVLPDRNALSEVGSLLRTHYLDFADPRERAELKKAWSTASGGELNIRVEFPIKTD